MAAKKKNTAVWVIGALILAVFAYLKRRELKKVLITPSMLAGMYRSLVSNPWRAFVTVDGKDIPWQIDLAYLTRDYSAVKAEYLRAYGSNLTDDLIEWFTPMELSDYVAALWGESQQVMTA